MHVRSKAILVVTTCLAPLGLATVTAAAGNGNVSSQVSPTSMLSSISVHVTDLADDLGIGGDEHQAAPGTLDDGEELLPEAKISIDDAIEAAKTSHTGTLGEIDLEHFKGKLVFNIDVGDQDVKVDAVTGAVIGSQSDD